MRNQNNKSKKSKMAIMSAVLVTSATAGTIGGLTAMLESEGEVKKTKSNNRKTSKNNDQTIIDAIKKIKNLEISLEPILINGYQKAKDKVIKHLNDQLSKNTMLSYDSDKFKLLELIDTSNLQQLDDDDFKIVKTINARMIYTYGLVETEQKKNLKVMVELHNPLPAPAPLNITDDLIAQAIVKTNFLIYELVSIPNLPNPPDALVSLETKITKTTFIKNNLNDSDPVKEKAIKAAFEIGKFKFLRIDNNNQSLTTNDLLHAVAPIQTKFLFNYGTIVRQAANLTINVTKGKNIDGEIIKYLDNTTAGSTNAISSNYIINLNSKRNSDDIFDQVIAKFEKTDLIKNNLKNKAMKTAFKYNYFYFINITDWQTKTKINNKYFLEPDQTTGQLRLKFKNLQIEFIYGGLTINRLLDVNIKWIN